MSDNLYISKNDLAAEPLEEGGRPIGEGSAVSVQVAHRPNPEVKPAKQRRRFTASYKLSILEELDRCTVIGEKGAVIRREGLYSSQITEWRHQRDDGALSALNKARGRKKTTNLKEQRIAELEKELAVLSGKLTQAETIIDIQKKVSAIFGSSSLDPEKSESKS